MASDDERLVVMLEARIRDFERNMAKASGTARRDFGDMRRHSQSATRGMEQDFERSTSRINQLISSTSTKIGGLSKAFAGGLVGGLAAGGVAGLVKTLGEVAKGIATIGDEAKRAGLSTKAFQELKFVAEQNRLGVDSLVDGIKELNLRADEWIQTGAGPAAEAFLRLGYDAITLKEKLKDPSALFTEIIGKLGQLDKAAQIRIADEVFGGTGGEKFVQLIEQGEEGIRKTIQTANDLGVVMDDELIRKAEELDRRFGLVATTVGTALKTAIVEAASALSDFVDEFKRIDQQYQQRKQAADLGALAGSMVGGVTPEVAEAIRNFEAQRASILKDIEQTENGIANAKDLQAPEEDVRAAEAQLAALQQQLAAVEAQIAAQRQLNLEKSRTIELDTINVGPTSSTGGRARYNPFVQTPATVNETPTRRTDPYFDDAGDARATGKTLGGEMAAEFIKKFEGFRKNAYWDVNAWRTGFGSDTTTGAGGGVSQVTAQTVTSLEAANRDLARRIEEFQSVIVRQLGTDTMAKFSEEQLAALTSIAYNYGDLPDRIVAAIKGGGDVGAAIRGLGGDNGGINRGRRNQEADLYEGKLTGATGKVGELSDAWEGVRITTKDAEAAAFGLQQQYDILGSIGVTAARGLANALADGKLEGEELLQILFDVVQQLLSMPAFPTGGGGAGGGGFGGILSFLFGGFKGFAVGGRVRGPGTSTSDSIPTMLSDGEYVVRAAAAKRHGKLLDAINSGNLRGYAAGGRVDHGSTAAAPVVDMFNSDRPINNLSRKETRTDYGSDKQDAKQTEIHVSLDPGLRAEIVGEAQKASEKDTVEIVTEAMRSIPDRIQAYNLNPRKRY